MNEIEFRRQCVINPHCVDTDFLAALKNPVFAAIHDSYIHFESQLLEAVRLPGKPDFDALKSITRQPVASGHTNLLTRWKTPMLSLAAGFAVLLIISAGFYLRPQPSISLSMLDHLYEHMEVTYIPTRVDTSKLKLTLHYFGAKMDHPMQKAVHYANVCDIGGTKSLHLVLDGQKGPVTVFYVPSTKVDSLHSISRNVFQGIVYTHAGGTIGIIGVINENLMDLKHQIDTNIVWDNYSRESIQISKIL